MTAPRLIAVDIGNSATKVGWFSEPLPPAATLRQPTSFHSFATGVTPPYELQAELPVGTCAWKIASVHREGTRILTKWLDAHRQHDRVQLLTHADLPIAIRVDFPERVGLDRLAAAVAANVLREPGRPAIVIGAGSAITVNLVAGDGAFEGGAILPGFRMSAEALYGADLLPLTMLAADATPPPVVGQHTEAAIRSGLFWGVVGGVREIVTRIAATLDQPPHIFVTGGDLRPLAAELGPDATFMPNLVLAGIAAIPAS